MFLPFIQKEKKIISQIVDKNSQCELLAFLKRRHYHISMAFFDGKQ